MSRKSIYTPTPSVWEQLLTEWDEDLADRGRRDSTRFHYGRDGHRFADWVATQDLTPERVSSAVVRTYVRHLREAGLGGRSISRHLVSLRSLFDVAVRDLGLAANPARAVEAPRFRKPLPKPLTRALLETYLDLPRRRGDTPTIRRDTALLNTFAWTGVRLSEAVSLNWDDIDLTPGCASLRVIDGKGGKDRVIPIVDRLADVLLAYLDVRLPLGAQRALFVGQDGTRLSRRRAAEIVAAYGTRMGTHVRPHLLRAGCAVEMIRAGASLPEVRIVLGHAGYDTLVAYTVLAADDTRASLAKAASRNSSAASSRSSGSQHELSGRDGVS
ncbi:MAG TPA: hypothetical protein ENH00_02590 [Actinobacteria bacterium]|nr:tyrosine recombinase XerC [bacterium BMS3Bbin01]HDH25067.1 hypothetical protein [Actinomycetota bacterium]